MPRVIRARGAGDDASGQVFTTRAVAPLPRNELLLSMSSMQPTDEGGSMDSTPIVYELDPAHSHLGFSVRHMMVSQQRGTIRGASGTLTLDRAHPSKSRVEVAIDVATINTNVTDRDNHLRGPDFFDVANHPTITFVSRDVRVEDDGQLRVTGDLTIRGTTRSVVLDADPVSDESKDMYGLTRVGSSATTKISRKDFGLVWNAILETGGVALADEVKITLDVQFIRKA
jgi:polyisoprenoid-binding protein YceI